MPLAGTHIPTLGQPGSEIGDACDIFFSHLFLKQVPHACVHSISMTYSCMFEYFPWATQLTDIVLLILIALPWSR